MSLAGILCLVGENRADNKYEYLNHFLNVIGMCCLLE